jgi:hypothetical protein
MAWCTSIPSNPASTMRRAAEANELTRSRISAFDMLCGMWAPAAHGSGDGAHAAPSVA